MIFTDASRNIQIELLGISSCNIAVLNDNLKQLEGLGRLLNAYIREAPLDGGSPVQFTYKVDLEKKYMAITGNMIEAINALQALDRIGVDKRDEIIMHLVTETNKEAFKVLSSGAQSLFINKIQAAILSTPPHSPHSPALFSH